MRFLIVLLVIVAGGAFPNGAAAQTLDLGSADAVAAALQTQYDDVHDFSAAFVHTYEGGLLRTTASERGLADAPVGNDLAADGKPYRDLTNDRVDALRELAAARLRVLVWMNGGDAPELEAH